MKSTKAHQFHLRPFKADWHSNYTVLLPHLHDHIARYKSESTLHQVHLPMTSSVFRITYKPALT